MKFTVNRDILNNTQNRDYSQTESIVTDMYTDLGSSINHI